MEDRRDLERRKRFIEKRKRQRRLKLYFNMLLVLCAILIVVLAATIMTKDKGLEYSIASLSFFDNGENNTVENKESNNIDEESETVEETTVAETESIDNTVHTVSFVATGDNLISDSVTHCGLQSDGSYDFTLLYDNLSKIFKKADLAAINQETILGGPDFPYTGFPNFNSPYEIGDSLIDAGFDIVTSATNHSYDMRMEGINNCINYWKKHPEVTMIGLNETKEKYDDIAVIEKNGIKIALLNYTYGLNGYSLPEDEWYKVNLIDEDKIKIDVEKAEEIADFTIVFPHWGVEYSTATSAEQRSLAKKMTEWGADLIIGTHPHVLQPIEWIETSNGNKSLCYYSLGNYTSSQDKTSTMVGGIAKLKIVKQGNDVHIKKGAGIIPIVTHYIWGSNRTTRTYKLTKYTEDLARVHSIHSVTDDFSIANMQKVVDEVVGDWVLD
ncbi:MAG: CapA family protein [Lachnospiraceae bacterium]|nr:CapA family protein [Lachnospiraceae bacterium]